MNVAPKPAHPPEATKPFPPLAAPAPAPVFVPVPVPAPVSVPVKAPVTAPAPGPGSAAFQAQLLLLKALDIAQNAQGAPSLPVTASHMRNIKYISAEAINIRALRKKFARRLVVLVPSKATQHYLAASACLSVCLCHGHACVPSCEGHQSHAHQSEQLLLSMQTFLSPSGQAAEGAAAEGAAGRARRAEEGCAGGSESAARSAASAADGFRGSEEDCRRSAEDRRRGEEGGSSGKDRQRGAENGRGGNAVAPAAGPALGYRCVPLGSSAGETEGVHFNFEKLLAEKKADAQTPNHACAFGTEKGSRYSSAFHFLHWLSKAMHCHIRLMCPCHSSTEDTTSTLRADMHVGLLQAPMLAQSPDSTAFANLIFQLTSMAPWPQISG